jgi:type I restriction enzyme M protein
MFFERYLRLLKKGGKLISIIDETLLSSSKFAFFRDFIRKYFIIHAVISLHGDAFRRSKSRVKTSLIYLEKKKNLNDEQPSTFMYSSIRLGVDDLPITSSKEKVVKARQLAEQEIERICSEFKRYENGEEDFWLISPERLKDRLDVKFCVPLQGRFVKRWIKKGYDVKPLSVLAQEKDEKDMIINPSEYPEKKFKLLAISYEGKCRIVEEKLGKHIKYPKMRMLKKGDLVISAYNSFNGAIGFITEEFDGALASGSYIILKCNDDIDAVYLWSILKTTELRTEFLSQSVGLGRQTVDWKSIKDIQIPLLRRDEREKMYRKLIDIWKKEKEVENASKEIKSVLNKNFDVESEESLVRFESSKPPK